MNYLIPRLKKKFIDCICLKIHGGCWEHIFLKFRKAHWEEVMIQMSFNFFQINHKTNSVNQPKIFFTLKLSISKFNLCVIYIQHTFLFAIPTSIKRQSYYTHFDLRAWTIVQHHAYILEGREDLTLFLKVLPMLHC